MDRIEFQLKLEKRDVRGATIRRLYMSRYLRAYYLFVLVVSILVFLTHKDSYDRSDYENVGMLISIALIFPVALALGASSRTFKHPDARKENLFVLDDEGFGAKFPSSEYRIKWNMIKSISETKKYIFMKVQSGPTVTIYKHRLPRETVSSIKRLLSSVPVATTKLLPDDKLE
jgi:hypothetical protein